MIFQYFINEYAVPIQTERHCTISSSKISIYRCTAIVNGVFNRA